MTAIVLIGKGDEVISQEVMSAAIEHLQRFSNFVALDVKQIMDIELSKCIAVGVGQLEPAIHSSTVTYAEIKAAVDFCLATFGDPEDNEYAFRVRLQKAFWRADKVSDESIRLRSAIEIFSKLHNRKLPVPVNALLSKVGMTFLKELCNTLLRQENM